MHIEASQYATATVRTGDDGCEGNVSSVEDCVKFSRALRAFFFHEQTPQGDVKTSQDEYYTPTKRTRRSYNSVVAADESARYTWTVQPRPLKKYGVAAKNMLLSGNGAALRSSDDAEQSFSPTPRTKISREQHRLTLTVNRKRIRAQKSW